MTETLRIAEGVIHRKVGEEMILLDYDRGIYYGLDPVGTRIWELIAEGKATDEIVATMAGEFDASPETIEADLGELLADLTAKALVKKL
jgi:hypothetical protein